MHPHKRADIAACEGSALKGRREGMYCTLAQLGLFLLDMHSHLLKFKSLGTSTSTSRGGSHVQDHMPPQICSARLTSCYPHIHRGRALVHARSRNQPPLSTTVSTANNRGRYIWNSLSASSDRERLIRVKQRCPADRFCIIGRQINRRIKPDRRIKCLSAGPDDNLAACIALSAGPDDICE